ncbi:hypothetical protein SAMN05192575_1042 [Nocardioides alpinus]|uniref:Uncharacterized protein n=2 Tax=Nocardioides alpinus TaxID=748909 RepID=A0A1I0YI74_9ACTN|nr:hypothetical protein CXG46_03560 [Nocardioides alpinus]SFB13145.1 hypothetical protein SAMN05192575_1042 [Nocardioides alpinus]
MAFVAWLLVMVGLWLSPTSPDPRLDLEGGGSFAAALTVYLPAIGITVAAVVMAIVAACTRAWVTAAVTVGGMTALFSAWTLSQDYLLDYRPSMDFYLWPGLTLAVLGVVLAASARSSREAFADPVGVDDRPTG